MGSVDEEDTGEYGVEEVAGEEEEVVRTEEVLGTPQ